MKTARNILLLSVLILSGCAKFPHEPVPSRGWQGVGENYTPHSDRGAEVRERETTVGEYSRRDPMVQR